MLTLLKREEKVFLVPSRLAKFASLALEEGERGFFQLCRGLFQALKLQSFRTHPKS